MLHSGGKQNREVHYGFQGGTKAVVVPGNDCQRVGVYAGSFDPVHAGHILFALKARKLADLERIYFVPERRPLGQNEPEHYVHRAMMLKTALRPHRHFTVMDLPDARLTSQSLARIRQELPATAEISLLTTASQLLWHVDALPALYERLQLVVAVTSHSQITEVLQRLQRDGKHFRNITFVDIGTDHISSAAVRSGLRKGLQVRGLLPSVLQYARRQWLYITPHSQG